MLGKMVKILLIIGLSILNHLVFATDNNQTISINITWDVISRSLLSDIHVKFNDFSCGQESYTYVDDGSFNSKEGIYTINIIGPFKQDQRTACTIGDDRVYFTEENARVEFSYADKPHYCNISQAIGTSFDHMFTEFNKLQGSIPGKWLECDDTDNGFIYRINTGHDFTILEEYAPGTIEIKAK